MGEVYHCDVGHDSHERVTLDIHLDENRKIPDFPAFRGDYETKMKLQVYDYDKYKDTVGYCTGRDTICHALMTQGIWEGYETLLMLDILKHGDRSKIMLDFGANLGWYSVLALINGYQVHGFEADKENMEVLLHNAEINDKRDQMTGNLVWVGEDYEYLLDEHVLLLKTDMEGNDPYAIGACYNLFEMGKVDYVVAEISPVLKGGRWFPDMVETIIGYGYRCYQIPEKDMTFMEEFEQQPLASVLKYCEIPTVGRIAYVASLRQSNFLFVRNTD